MNILIVDYGMGNIKSVHKKLHKTHANLKVSSNPKDVLWADKIILVGVGHFKKAMDNLNNLNLIDELNDYVLVKKKTYSWYMPWYATYV